MRKSFLFSSFTIFSSIVLLVSSCSLISGNTGSFIKEVKLPTDLQSGKLEFSSMAWLNSTELLLVPQYPDRFHNEIYTVNSRDIGHAIKSDQPISKSAALTLVNLEAIKKQIGATYQGFEATTVIGERIFFSIETDSLNANCFIIGGTLHQNSIVLDSTKVISLPKLKRLKNAGYESLAWLPGKKKLVAFFEYNKADVGSKAFFIDTSLVMPPETLPFDPLMFRITDVASISPNRLLGIQHHYNGSKREFTEYIGADSLMAFKPLNGKTLRQSSYTGIIELSVGANKVSWAPKKVVTLRTDNWEGIAPFKKGVLIITDEFPGSIMKWVGL